MSTEKEHIEAKLLAYWAGELAAADRRELEEWLSVPENLRYANRLKTLSEGASFGFSSPAGKEAMAASFDAPAAWAKVKSRTVDRQQPVGKLRSIASWQWAAAACLLLALAWWALSTLRGGDEEWTILASGEHVRKEILPDSTVVWLQPGTELRYSFRNSHGKRITRLKGEAFFEVKPDSVRPFSVLCGASQTQVLGTSFLIRQEGDSSVFLQVESGKVRFGGLSGETIDCRAGDRARFASGSAPKLQSEGDANSLFWVNGELRYSDAPLSAVFSDLQRFFKVSVEPGALELAKDCRITARFRAATAEKVVKALETDFGWQCEWRDSVVIFRGVPCIPAENEKTD